MFRFNSFLHKCSKKMAMNHLLFFFHGGIQQLLIQKQKVNNKLIVKILSKKF